MEDYNGITCVPAAVLIEKGLVSPSYYKQLCHRGRLNVVRRGCNSRPALVEFDTMPGHLREQVERIFGNPKKAAERNGFASCVETDPDAFEFFKKWKWEDEESGQVQGLRLEKQKEYTNNASILQALRKWKEAMTAARAAKGKTIKNFWDKAVEWVDNMMDEWPHSLPSNARRLKDRYDAFLKDGYVSLIHKGYCNTNKQKIDEQTGNILVRLYGNGCPKLSFEDVGERYNKEIAPLLGKEMLTVAAIKHYLNRPENRAKWYAPRHGGVQAMNDIMPQARRRKVSTADDIWSIDGTPVQLYYQAGGKLYSDLYLYVVTDAASRAIIGYSMGTSENSRAVLDALRNAMESQLYLPAQLQYDQGTSNVSGAVAALMDNMAEVAFPCQARRARAKYVEAIQGHFQTLVLRLAENFKGGNITARSLKSRINPDTAKQLKQNAPTYDQLVEQVKEAVVDWNTTAHKRDKFGIPTGETPLQLYQRPAESRRKVTFFEIQSLYVVDMYNKADVKGRYKYTPRGIEMVVDGEKHYFIVPDDDDAVTDINFQRYNQGRKFSAKMNVQHPWFIELYDEGKYVGRAVDKTQISAGIMDARRHKDGDKVRKLQEAQNEWTRANEQEWKLAATGTDGMVSPLTMKKGAWNRYEGDAIDRVNGIEPPAPTEPITPHNEFAEALAKRLGK